MANSELIRRLRSVLGMENVLSAPSELAVYDCDAYTVERRPPAAVVFPRSTQQVSEVVRICANYGAPIVARGAGTGLAGGCSPLVGGVVLMLTRMNRILEIRLRDALALVEPGVVNLQLTQALAGTGYHYAPDPSSQGTSTIGGNVATNAGGPHTLKLGVTTNHIAGLEFVLPDGAIVEVGPVEDPAALDLARVVCGSEGTLAIVTKIWARLTRLPQSCRTVRASFGSIEDASQVVSRIIAAGILPAALELMDRGILDAVEDAFALGVSREAAAVLVIELDGAEAGLDVLLEQVVAICRERNAAEILQATTAAERELLWKCRKMAVGAVGRLAQATCFRTASCRERCCREFSVALAKSPRSITCESSAWPMPATATSIRSCCSIPAIATLLREWRLPATRCWRNVFPVGAASRPNMASASRSSHSWKSYSAPPTCGQCTAFARHSIPPD